MKLGTENRKKVIAAAALIVIAVVLMAARFSGLGSSSAAASQPATVAADIRPVRPAGSASGNLHGGLKKKTEQWLDPTLRTDLLRSTEDIQYEGTGRNIFKAFAEPPRPGKLIVPPVAPLPQQAFVPAIPPIGLRYYGYTTPEGGTKRIFLAGDKDVFIAREGEIVDRRYKVVRITPNAVEILDVLSNRQETIPLTQG